MDAGDATVCPTRQCFVVQTKRTAESGWCDVEVYGTRWLEEARADAAQTARWLPEGAQARVVLRTITDMPVR